jgi:hypothetical protein
MWKDLYLPQKHFNIKEEDVDIKVENSEAISVLITDSC